VASPLIYPSTLTQIGTVNLPFYIGPEAAGVKIDINYTAEGGGTATLDAKLQVWDASEQAWDDLLDSAGTVIGFAQFTGVSEDSLTVYPGLVEKLTGTNRHYNSPIPAPVRLVCTVAAATVTFAVAIAEL
jgi:hypothetical protein